MALIICCSPAASNAAETLSSLRFGVRTKGIMTSVQVLHSNTLFTRHSAAQS